MDAKSPLREYLFDPREAGVKSERESATLVTAKASSFEIYNEKLQPYFVPM